MANPWGLSDAQTDTRVLTSGITSALVNAVNSGNTLIIEAIVGARIRVVEFTLTAGGAVDVSFKSSTRDISGPYHLVLNSPVTVSQWFQTGVDNDLIINLSAGVAVSGTLLWALG